jgi:apolipoprotein N-acyltransferase
MFNTQMVVNMHERFYVNAKIAYLIPYLVAFISGALLPLAFAPFDFWPIAILSPLTLLILWNRISSPLKACLLGGSYGLGMFGMGISWVFVSIHRYGNTIIPVAIFITFLLVAICAAYIALQGYLLKRFFKTPNAAFWLIGFPCSWVLIEWFRGWLFTGFPWLYLGYSQLNTPLAGFAPILGVYGISFVLTLIAGLCVNFYYGNKISKILSLILIPSIFAAGFMLQKIQWTTPTGNPTTVSMIQGNVGPLDKFTQADPIDATDKIYGKLTQTVLNSSLILWPESAIPLPYPYSKEYIKKLNKLAVTHKTTLITGMQFTGKWSWYLS